MDINLLEKMTDWEWRISAKKRMRVPAIIFASQTLIEAMDHKVYEQLCNVASLPGIVNYAYAMPDAHWGYGFPIGGVAAFDPNQGGVVSAGGVGFDISCGVRLLTTGLTGVDLAPHQEKLADALFAHIPSGVGSQSRIHLTLTEMDEMLLGGAAWTLRKGFGEKIDLERIEERGCMTGAIPEYVSDRAKERQQKEMGTLGSGNHYLEVQQVMEIFDSEVANIFGLAKDNIVISIHCGSRGLGHQIGTDYMRLMITEAKRHNIMLPDRELACAPLNSEIAQQYLGAMRCGINCALANREIITHFVRETINSIIPRASVKLVYDVSHNTCKEEFHEINHKKHRLFVHRKGATRAFGPGHPELPAVFFKVGQPVIIGGSMGTSSFVLAGTQMSEMKSFSSACHGAGRAMSRHHASRQWRGDVLIKQLAQRGILIRSASYRGVAEEAPASYKEIEAVIDAAEQAQLAKKVARLAPVICIKG